MVTNCFHAVLQNIFIDYNNRVKSINLSLIALRGNIMRTLFFRGGGGGGGGGSVHADRMHVYEMINYVSVLEHSHSLSSYKFF